MRQLADAGTAQNQRLNFGADTIELSDGRSQDWPGDGSLADRLSDDRQPTSPTMVLEFIESDVRFHDPWWRPDEHEHGQPNEQQDSPQKSSQAKKQSADLLIGDLQQMPHIRWSHPLLFYPDGRTEKVEIHLEGLNNLYRVTVCQNGWTGTVRVLSR